jgi:hypothetical protein
MRLVAGSPMASCCCAPEIGVFRSLLPANCCLDLPVQLCCHQTRSQIHPARRSRWATGRWTYRHLLYVPVAPGGRIIFGEVLRRRHRRREPMRWFAEVHGVLLSCERNRSFASASTVKIIEPRSVSGRHTRRSSVAGADRTEQFSGNQRPSENLGNITSSRVKVPQASTSNN